MRIAFYAPMKPPTAPRPSGDRQIARLLIKALKLGGHDVTLASSLRSYDRTGDPQRLTGIRRRAERHLPKVLERLNVNPPDLWFTYHLYHRAPDWLGPAVTEALNIPYILAEASFAPKQSGGPWADGHVAVEKALNKASHIFSLRPLDRDCILPLLRHEASESVLTPFLDTAPFTGARSRRHKTRMALGSDHEIPANRPWLLATGMFRHDNRKWPSYQLLAKALTRVADRPWHLLIAGTGPAEQDIRRLFDPVAKRITWLGEVPHSRMANLYAASDLFVWPSINEAVGMALLEAMAAGCPVITGRCGSVADALGEDAGAIVVSEGDSQAFANGLGDLLDRPADWPGLGEKAARYVNERHSLAIAAQAINSALLPILGKLA